jgi:hypothetical protein
MSDSTGKDDEAKEAEEDDKLAVGGGRKRRGWRNFVLKQGRRGTILEGRG